MNTNNLNLGTVVGHQVRLHPTEYARQMLLAELVDSDEETITVKLPKQDIAQLDLAEFGGAWENDENRQKASLNDLIDMYQGKITKEEWLSRFHNATNSKPEQEET